MRLTNRQETVKSMIPFGARLLDIGCDHAMTAISLITEGKIVSAIAADINPYPLKSGKDNAARLGVKNIEFVLSDGFSNIENGGYDCVAICGMGGELISEIIKEGGEKAKECKLILQPMTAFEKLREFLWCNGFTVTEERFATEGKRPYCVIAAYYSGKNEKFRYSDLYLGKVCPNTPEFYAFSQKIASSARKRLNGAVCRNQDCTCEKELIERVRIENEKKQ